MQSLQARLKTQGDERLYSANRDVAHNFGEVMEEVVSRINAGQWDTITAYVKEKGLADETLGKACDALCRFIAGQMQTKAANMGEELTAAGWFAVPAEARLVVMAYLGTVTLGIHWGGVREATMGGVGPALGLRDLRWHGHKCVKLMRLPWWRRRLYMVRRRLRLAWRALRRWDYQ